MVDRFAAALDSKDRGFEAPFLSNHDTGRGIGLLGWNAPEARVAAATLLAMPGTPFLYYGDELGMRGQGSSGDPGKRTPYRWTTSTGGYHGFTTGTTTWFDAYAPPTEPAGVELETQRADPASLYNLFRNLIKLRHAQPPLARGGATRLAPTGGGNGAFAQVRTWEGKRVLFVANFAKAASGAFTVGRRRHPRGPARRRPRRHADRHRRQHLGPRPQRLIVRLPVAGLNPKLTETPT